MQKTILSGVLAISLLTACAGDNPAATPPATAEPAIKAGDQVVAEGKVVPLRSAALSFQSAGLLAEVLVHEGEAVRAGQPLARLDNASETANLARAEAQLKAAEARLQDLTDGPSPADVEVTKAQLRQAQASYQQTLAGVTPADITAVQAQIQAAQAQLTRLRAGAQNPDVRNAQANLSSAQASLETQRSQLSANKTSAEKQLQQAADQLVQAQTTYSTARWNWQHVEAHGTDPVNPSVVDPATGKSKSNKLNEVQKQQYHDALTRAEAALHAAEAALQQAQVAVDNAHSTEITGLQSAEQQVVSAQANLDSISSSIRSDQLAQARSQLASAQANLQKLRGPQRESQIAAAQAGVDTAQANLDRLNAPPQPSEVTALQAQVESARAERDAAKAALERTELKAPFAGAIAALDLHEGEQVNMGVAVIQLADTSAWQIETTDLTELNIVRVREGSAATITFDAIPGLELPGKVLRVKGFGDNRQGDIVYRVVIQPDRFDERLKWNMTASVSIATAPSQQ